MSASPSFCSDTDLDPKLAARLKQQEIKVETGESVIENISSPREIHAELDPRLAERLKRQAAKLITNESAVGELSSPREWSTALDPKLAARFKAQQLKEETGESAIGGFDPVPHHGPVITDPMLAACLEKQRAKALSMHVHEAASVPALPCQALPPTVKATASSFLAVLTCLSVLLAVAVACLLR